MGLLLERLEKEVDFMDIRLTSLAIGETEDTGPVGLSTSLTFPRDVQAVAVGITGYTARFDHRNDHNFGRLELEVNARINDGDHKQVDISGVFGLRDWSNEFDDSYSGLIDLAVLADLVPAVVGPTRGDLIIMGAERSQVIQHFRSAQHLDAANVFPDNSIRMVARKPTIVRLYVDYDASSGLPVIASLSGELVVGPAGASAPLPPVAPITPRRDSTIDRGNRRHTLNFVIPEASCVGTVDITATVFDAADRTQQSAPFAATIVFEQLPSLPVLAVGVNYTGPDVVAGSSPADLAAPLQADFVTTLAFTEAVYPIPEAVITSYLTVDYDKPTISDISNGCDKFDDLRDAVAEMRGDSDDVVYGLYNVGVDTGSVGGCGGGGAGVGRLGGQATAAHEIGHALGRKHAPCDNVTRCATPLDTDDDYPVYVGYDSDSIGEYGVDPRDTNANVVSPASFHDFMGYSGSKWISPYTYKALMAAVPTVGGGAAADGAARTAATEGTPAIDRRRDRAEWVPIKQPKLFLRLDIDGDGSVELQPSFHFAARPRPTPSEPTDYRIEMLDAKGHRLTSTCLMRTSTSCGCGCDDGGGDGPISIRQAVPLPDDAAEMVLLRCGERVADWRIPPPFEVGVELGRSDDGGLCLLWGQRETEVPPRRPKRGASAAADDESGALWALAQWRHRDGDWRGFALRTRSREIPVPRAVYAVGGEVQLRVLVTSGITTSVGEWTGTIDPGDGGDAPSTPGIVLGVTRSDGDRTELPSLITAAVVDDGGRSVSIRWHIAGAGELARGRSLALHALPVGQTTVTATAVAATGRAVPSQWLIERTADDRYFWLHGDQRSPSVYRPTTIDQEV
jgi:hypothetical protein